MSNHHHDPESAEGNQRRLQDYARWSGVGLEFSASVALCGWLGWLLDGWLALTGRFPLFLLIGVFAGLALGIYRLQLKVAADTREDDSSDPEA